MQHASQCSWIRAKAAGFLTVYPQERVTIALQIARDVAEGGGGEGGGSAKPPLGDRVWAPSHDPLGLVWVSCIV